MVYSTCSLNPIEDEAVVMEVLRRCGGQVYLVDVRAMYPQLRRMDGLLQWKVACAREDGLIRDRRERPPPGGDGPGGGGSVRDREERTTVLLGEGRDA